MPDHAELPIHDMAQRHHGLTTALADAQTEAAVVCLDRHHQPPKEFVLDVHGEREAAVMNWQQANERAQRAWANETDATELGAYACVLAAVELVAGLVAVGRAETMTGADYYVAPHGATTDIEHLDDCVRLEVSGTDHGPESTVNKRLAEKLTQASAGDSNLPALAGVVGFKAKLIKIAELESGNGS